MQAWKLANRLVAVVAATLSVEFALAASAKADDPEDTYTVTWSDGTRPTQWTFMSCGPGCTHVIGNAGWATDARLIDGRWVMGPVKHTSVCADGTTEMDTNYGSFDAVTVSGVSAITYPVACREDPPNGLTVQFQLSPTN